MQCWEREEETAVSLRDQESATTWQKWKNARLKQQQKAWKVCGEGSDIRRVEKCGELLKSDWYVSAGDEDTILNMLCHESKYI